MVLFCESRIEDLILALLSDFRCIILRERLIGHHVLFTGTEGPEFEGRGNLRVGSIEQCRGRGLESHKIINFFPDGIFC